MITDRSKTGLKKKTSRIVTAKLIKKKLHKFGGSIVN